MKHTSLHSGPRSAGVRRRTAAPAANAAAEGEGTRVTGQACYVRVTGTRDARFVEFEFAIGDPALAVELVLQFDQFREFCARHAAHQLTPEDGARLDYERMKWRYGAPGIDH